MKDKFNLTTAPKPAASGKPKFEYRTKDKHGKKKETAVYSIKPELADKVERDAHWRGLTKSELIEILLTAHYTGKDFEPIPAKNINL